LFTPEDWQKKSAAFLAEQEKQRNLEAATVAFAQPGQMQTERDYNQQGTNSSPVQLDGRYGRRGTDWFSFDMPVDTAHPMTLVVTYNTDERQKRTFDVQVEGKQVGQQTIEKHTLGDGGTRFFDVEYPVPADAVKDRQKVTVRFQATDGNEIGGVFGIRMVRSDAQAQAK
jgi:hypothetical protein